MNPASRPWLHPVPDDEPRRLSLTALRYLAATIGPVLTDPELTPSECRLYLALLLWAGPKGKTWRSLETMARAIGLSKHTLYRGIRALRRRKLIRVFLRRKNRSRYRTLSIRPAIPVSRYGLETIEPFEYLFWSEDLAIERETEMVFRDAAPPWAAMLGWEEKKIENPGRENEDQVPNLHRCNFANEKRIQTRRKKPRKLLLPLGEKSRGNHLSPAPLEGPLGRPLPRREGTSQDYRGERLL